MKLQFAYVSARRAWLLAGLVSVFGLTAGFSADPSENPSPIPDPAEDAASATHYETVAPSEAKDIAHDGAELHFPAGALTAATTIGIKPLQLDDLPEIDYGMTNVTAGPRAGYRFTPHGSRFNEWVTVTLPYDLSLLPAGHTPEDIHTHFFDDASGSWQPLERVAVDADRQVVISRTSHFTDMVNATVTVPDHPTPVSFNPTSIKDLKAADPGAGINLIEPPQPNNSGSTNLLYSIELPPGRGGMQPNIAVQYNSAGENGWLGLGWDTPMQAITIDTRWGVPRYDAGLETETYLLNGEQMTPVAHRGELQPRTAEKEYHARVEGMFRKIIRHGDNPTNYWWEVIDKNGTRSFYGGDPVLNAPAADSTLTDPAPGSTQNIYKWALREVRDTNGNFMKYNCVRVNNTGLPGGSVDGVQLYLDEIRYTGFGADDGPYSLRFIREQGRPDVMIDCRGGFKMVTADRLIRIEVKFGGELIRSYQFEYETGAFEKTRLIAVSQYGENGELFNTHTFEYFDEVSTATPNVLNGFSSTPAFEMAKTISGNGLLLAGVDSTALQADITDSQQTEGSAGVSLAGVIGIGGRASFGSSDSISHLTLVDINGDTLPDQLYQSDGDFFFRANVGGPASAPNFGDEIALTTLSQINKDHSSTRTYGGSITIGVSISGETAKTTTEGEIYLIDVNGDLLPDLVDHSQVYFNHLESGVPTFTPDSPVPLTPGAPSNTQGLIQNPQEDRAEQERAFHLVDPIRRWVAPYHGTVSISGAVRLITAPPMDYTTADGVRASIQRNGTELWSTAITDANDLAAHAIAGLDAVVVSAGDRLYFRVNSINDGAFDEVEFDPTITYVGRDLSKVDENGMPLFVYHAASDFAFGGRPLIFAAPATGSATFAGDLVKSQATTDDITLQVRKGPSLATLTVVHEQTVAWDQSGAFPVNVPVDTLVGEFLQVTIQTDSRIDLTKLSFVPRTIPLGALAEGGLEIDTCADGVDNDGNGLTDAVDPTCLEAAGLLYTIVDGQPAPQLPNGDPAFLFNLPVSMQSYPRKGSTKPKPYMPFVARQDGTIHVHWSVDTTPLAGNFDTDLTLSVKRPDQRLAKQHIEIVNGAIVGPSSLDALISVSAGDELYFVADATAAQTVADFFDMLDIMPPELSFQIPFPPVISVPFDLHLGIAADEAFGGGFRCWSYGQYNGDLGQGEGGGFPSTCADGLDNDGNGFTDLADPLCALPIDETRLRLPTTETDPVVEEFLQMAPFVEQNNWHAQDEESFISEGRMSASRLGVNHLDFPDGSGLGGDRGIVRSGGDKTSSSSLSFLGFGGGSSSGTNWSDIDFLDFNGDSYPDVVGGGEVQSTLPNGALEANRIVVGGFGRVRESDSETCNINLGATITREISNSRGNVESISTEKPAYNLSAGVTGGRGDFDAKWDLIDINGDGLPDYVRRSGSGLVVQLNLGYRFAAEETWDSTDTLRREQSILRGLSVGAGVTTPSYGLGGGVSHTQSTSAALNDLIDVNGDGLIDIVSKDLDNNPLADLCIPLDLTSDSTDLTVRFNTGNQFTAPFLLIGAMARPLRSQVTVSRSIGVNGSVSIPAGPVLISLGAGHSESRSLGGFEVMLRDFDGDGYADHLYSDTTGRVELSLNNHGRTNLLRKIHRPLGATITLDYQRDGNTIDLPQSRWNLSRVEIDDGFCGDGVDKLVGTYVYEDGRYDRVEREFYGYGAVIAQQRDSSNGDSLFRTTATNYLNDSFYSKGLMSVELVQDAADNKFTESINTYNLVDISTGTQLIDPNSTTATVFPQMIRTDRLFYEGQAAPGKSTFTTQAYDLFGNISEMFDAGDVGAEDDLTSTIGYFTDLAAYIVGIPDQIVVTGNGAELRRREATIEAGTGDLRQVRQHLETGEAAITDLDYFPNGNLQRVTGAPNLHGERYVVEFEYDAPTATHIISISDSFGYASTAAYDLRFGKVDVTTDINGNQKDYDYDGFGRIVAITGPYETGGAMPTLRFEYHPDQTAVVCPNQVGVMPWALTRHIDPFRDINDPIDTVLFADGLKRVLQTKKDGTIHTAPGAAPQDVMIVSGRVTFDLAERVIEQFYPTTEPLGSLGVFNPAYDSVVPTRTEYDVLDRATVITLPDNTTTSSAYGFGPDRNGVQQFETIVTDANGIEKRTYRNVRELVTSIREVNNGGAEVIWTSYAYDPIEQLVQVTDDHSNVTHIAHDNFGRTVAIDNPDAGLTESQYDLANNLTAKITANLSALNQQISYDYQFRRPKSITYPLFAGNNVTYSYGDPGAAFNRAGRVVTATSEAGSEERFYGKLGELVTEIKTVASDTQGNSPNSPEIYTTEYLYDTWNRLQQLIYPDGEVLTYQYDSGGLVSAATGVKNGFTFPYLQRLEYDKFEQRAFMQMQNQVRTTYAYDPLDRRLATLTAGKVGGPLFQNLQYAYDDVGNILQTHNQVPVPPPNQFGGPVLQNYTYDDLYRLVSASGTHQYAPNKTSQYSLSMTYDTIHNITYKAQVHELVQPSGQAIPQQKTTYTYPYAYDGPQPHAPTHIGERTYSYDADGNQLGWEHDQNGTDRTIVWDEENRIQSIFDNGHEKTYKYDDSGERVIKRGPQGETAYVNAYFTVRNRTIATKHIYADVTRVASKLSPGFTNPQPPNGVPESNFLYFYHPDHLGSSSYVTAANGNLFEHLQYFPFGETWVQEKSNTQNTPYLYTAKELDEETDLYYFGARYYDPRTSVWQNPDPIFAELLGRFEPKNLSVYAYALHNPLRFTDPTGLDAEETKAQILKLSQSEKAADRQKALDLIFATYGKLGKTGRVKYDEKYTGLATTDGVTKVGAIQTIIVGPAFFNILNKVRGKGERFEGKTNFEVDFNEYVRTLVAHEGTHVIQKSVAPLVTGGKKSDPGAADPLREFLATYAELTAEIPNLPQLNRKQTARQITGERGAEQWWNAMTADQQKPYTAQYQHVQRLLKWAEQTKSTATDRPTKLK